MSLILIVCYHSLFNKSDKCTVIVTKNGCLLNNYYAVIIFTHLMLTNFALMNESRYKVIHEINHILNCKYEINQSYDPCSYEHNFSNSVEKPENSGLQ